MHPLIRPTAALCTAVLLSAAAQATPATPAQTQALIRQQSQAFSDASASGDAATLARYLDDRVTFINESGEVATKAEILAGTSPNAAGLQNRLVQTDFRVQLFGDTAVTSFVDVSTVHFQGQVLHAKYLSTEVWRSTADGWKMISSQTMAVPDDPPAIALPAATLDEYVGRYRAGPSFVFSIERQGDGLVGRSGNGAAMPMKAEVKDVLFTPGQPRLRRIFQRDAQGRITGFVSRREGHDLLLRREG